MARRQDPFETWALEQLMPAAARPRPEVELQLTPQREARVMVAWCDWRLARLRAGALLELTTLQDDLEWQTYLAVNDRAWAQQAAEDLAQIPETLDGCIAVLDVAARIIETLGPAAMAAA